VSWDIYLGRFDNIESVADIPDDFEPQPLGSKGEVRQKLIAVLEGLTFDDTGWGMFEHDGGVIEVPLGDTDPVVGLTLFVRGTEATMPYVERVLAALKCRGIDCQTGEFYQPETAAQSFADWASYRDQVIRGGN
jgi:hypothetical protein